MDGTLEYAEWVLMKLILTVLPPKPGWFQPRTEYPTVIQHRGRCKTISGSQGEFTSQFYTKDIAAISPYGPIAQQISPAYNKLWLVRLD